MAGIKIVDLPAVGRDLAATDLFEMSLVGGTGSRKITGQEIMNASKLSVNNTPVINGTAGRIFFQDAANVLQQSANLFWDNTNGRLGIGTNTPSSSIHIATNNASVFTQGTFGSSSSTGVILRFQNQDNTLQSFIFSTGTSYTSGTYQSGQLNMGSGASGGVAIRTSNAANAHIRFYSGNADPDLSLEIARFVSNTGNLLINTTTDAGFKLDVNGTARVSGNTLLDSGIIATSSGTTRLQSSLNFFSHQRLASSGAFGFDIRNSAATQCALWTYDAGSGNINFGGSTSAGALLLSTNNAERLRIFQTTGNIAINTTTDNGYKLEVNGTGRISSSLNVGGNGTTGTSLSAGFIVQDSGNSVASSFVHCQGAQLSIFANPQGFAAGGFEPSSGGLSSTNAIAFMNGSTTRMKIPTTGNVLIGTTTDAGFKLDVNGTARVNNDFTIGSNRYLKAFRWTQDDVTKSLQLESNSNYNVDSVNVISLNNSLLNNTKNLINIGLSSTVGTQSSGSNDAFNSIYIQTAYNFPFGTHAVKGIYYNPTLTSMVGTTHHAFHSTSGRIRFEGLPTSPTGLSAGDLYNDGGTIKIV